MRHNHRDDYQPFDLSTEELSILVQAKDIAADKLKQRHDHHPVARDATAKVYHGLDTLLRHVVITSDTDMSTPTVDPETPVESPQG